MADLGAGLVVITKSWEDLKDVVLAKNLRLQYDDRNPAQYEIFAIDGGILYTTVIFTGTVPPVSDTDQTQNDIDKADFETNYQPDANQAIVPTVLADGDAIPAGSVASLMMGSDGTNAQLLRTAVDGTIRVDPTGTTTQPISGTVGVSGSVAVTGPLTDTQLRATSVPVSGPLTDTQLRATPVPVSGTVTATGPLTDAQLRATPVPISGTVTANLGTVDGLALDATLTGGTARTKITDGTNNAAVKAASTAPVAADPALVVSISPNSIVTTTTGDSTKATFTAVASSVVLGNGKSLISIQNLTASAVIAKIWRIYLVNTATSAVTGVTTEFQIRRFATHSAGTVITPQTHDSANSLDSSITVRTGASLTTEASAFIDRRLWSSDDWGPGTLDVEAMDHASQSVNPNWNFEGQITRPLVLRANEGVTIRCNTNTTAGQFDVIVVFTQE